MEQMIKDSENAFIGWNEAMRSYTDIMDESRRGTDYYYPVFSDKDIEKGWQQITKEIAELKFNLANTKKNGSEQDLKEAHRIFQEHAIEATKHVRHVVDLISKVHDDVNQKKKAEASSAIGWFIFWGVIIGSFIGLMTFLIVRQ